MTDRRKKVIVAVAGIVLGVLCSQLPEAYRQPCDVVSRVIPAACGGPVE